MPEYFDHENVYDEQIAPLMTQIITICKTYRIPMMCSFAYKNDDETEMNFCSTALNAFEDRLVPEYTRAVRVLRGNDYAIAIMSGEKGDVHD
ncbi:hypothetical protein LU631_07015 [Erwinia tracheiphila]|uniref:hypothetical protein n=1 Tax=Erwinia tracheiphila TaxID=65700 RepID=UPI00033B0953|nr:hypothetical protein [Erwinia tracheiphila]EOS93124.1 hypothetical protein ETR_20707 [Erwinia tracheiphila PSU-1]UIA89011.1 hypothetical protein LU631_07015 [Erwinia tracheiphila]UIA97394.1 hypothetical protein LU633_05695 [Erwinia tracheiphila]